MKIFKGMLLLVAICAIHNGAAVDLLVGAPVTSIQGANYQRFSKEYKGYLINQNNQVDLNWVRGALAALQNDGLYNPNNFLNILWGDIESLANYYAQGNQAFKEATRQSLISAFNHIGGTFRVPQPVASPWESRQVVPTRSLPPVPQAQPAQSAPQPSRVTPPAVSFSIRNVMDGVLGSAYASKVQEIYSYNDALALKRGEHSLKGKLSDAIASANANSSPQGKVTQLKSAIDEIYGYLQAYRIKDNAQMSQQAAMRPLPAAPMALSFESILNGALGEPYTSRANEINNSNATQYVNALRADINTILKAGYTNDAERVRPLQAVVDRLYGFLSKYRNSQQ